MTDPPGWRLSRHRVVEMLWVYVLRFTPLIPLTLKSMLKAIGRLQENMPDECPLLIAAVDRGRRPPMVHISLFPTSQGKRQLSSDSSQCLPPGELALSGIKQS